MDDNKPTNAIEPTANANAIEPTANASATHVVNVQQEMFRQFRRHLHVSNEDAIAAHQKMQR